MSDALKADAVRALLRLKRKSQADPELCVQITALQRRIEVDLGLTGVDLLPEEYASVRGGNDE